MLNPFSKHMLRAGAITLISLASLPQAHALSLVDSAETDTSLMHWLSKQSKYELTAEQVGAFVSTTSAEALTNDVEVNLATIASISDFHKDLAPMLAVLDQLATKAPIYARSSKFVITKARLLLVQKQFDTARAVILARWDQQALSSVCTPDDPEQAFQPYSGDPAQEQLLCTPRVRAWLSTGKLVPSEWPKIEGPALYDARAQCAVAFPEESNAIETALDSGQLSPVERAKLSIRKAWPVFLAGCSTFQFDTSQHLGAAYGDNVLRDEYQSALASVSVERPSSLLLFGESLPLPRTECDFDRAPDCSQTKALSKLTAQRFAQRLNELNYNLTAESGQCVEVPKAEQQRREALVETLKAAIEQIMAAKPARTDSQRLAALDKLLDTSLSGLDYEMHTLLAEPLVKLAKTDANGAVAVQKKLIAALGIKASDTHWSHLAILQLMARDPRSAAVSLKEGLRLDYDSDTASTLALLEAVQAGARPDFFASPKRPWTLPTTYAQQVFIEEFTANPLNQDLVYLGTLPSHATKDYLIRRDWQKVLAAASALAQFGDTDEMHLELPKLKLSGSWRDDSFIVGTITLPWPDAFALEGGQAKQLTMEERSKLFKALGVSAHRTQ